MREGRYMAETLTGIKIKKLVEEGKIIENGSINNCGALKYDFTLSDEILKADFNAPIKMTDLSAEARREALIQPGEVVYVLTKETVNLPTNMYMSLSANRGMSEYGVLTLGGFAVDPGYSGKLMFGLYNYSSTPFTLMPGEKLIGGVFYQLDENGREKRFCHVGCGYFSVVGRLSRYLSYPWRERISNRCPLRDRRYPRWSCQRQTVQKGFRLVVTPHFRCFIVIRRGTHFVFLGENMEILNGFIGFLTGIISGFGVGGGSLLVLYLTVFGGVDQYTAGGVNLLYFTGCAPAALVTHIREKRIVWRAVWLCLVTGVPLSILAAVLSSKIDVDLLHQGFGFVLLYIGFKEIFTKSK